VKVALNFADENFTNAQKLNSKTALWFGGFDKVYSFSPHNIDEKFYTDNASILKQKKGCGFWLWKPYFISKVLAQLSNDDYLFYCDSGAYYINTIDYLIDVMETNHENIMLFENPLLERQWTNKNLFKEMDAMDDWYKDTNQITGGYILLKKSDAAVDFIHEYLGYCVQENLVTDLMTTEDEEALEHRHDQSILSILGKKHKIHVYKDPSDYGIFPHRYFAEGRVLKINQYSDQYPVVVLSNRDANPFIYFIKYRLRNFLRRFSVQA